MPAPALNTLARRAGALALALLATIGAARADEPAAWAALRQPGAVALVRHADAPGIGDPAGWRIGDCSTQRNLSERGRADARALGARLRAERIPIAKVLSSPWCRCADTARLMDVGPVQVEPNFGNAYVMSERAAALAEGGSAVIRAWRGPGVLLVVTHGENINALTGRSLASGELVVVVPGADGALRPVGSLRVDAPQR